MFEAPKHFHRYPDALAAGERAFTTLVRSIEECQAAGSLPRGDSKPLALLAWSMVHGVAKLAVAGQLPFSGSDEMLQFTDAATYALMRGISNVGGPNNRHPRKGRIA
jgi:hypothetical protein